MIRNCGFWWLSGWVALLALLAVGLPIFLCMPPWLDVTQYDLAARNLLHGGVHYRDIYDNNLPGAVWIQALIRTLFGWRSETLRAADAAIVGGIVFLLCRWLRCIGLSRAACLWSAVALAALYLSTSEVCHCQRDPWALLPGLAALTLRRHQMSLLTDPKAPNSSLLGRAILEGVLWGAAVWIKPFVAVPALACWLLCAILVFPRTPEPFKRLATDGAGVLLGGLIAGGLGCAWLIATGAWGPFCNIFLEWNRDYYAIRFPIGQKFMHMLERFKGWNLVYYPAMLVGIVLVGLGILRRRRVDPSFDALVLLAGAFLAWLAQAVLLQHPHDYVYVPVVLLALAVVLGALGRVESRSARMLAGVAFAGFLLAALVHHPPPLSRRERLQLWPRCWREGSSPELRNRLALHDVPQSPDWVALDQVADFLRRQNIGDGDVLCFNDSTHPLYLMLDVEPGIPILHFDAWYLFYSSHHDQLHEMLERSPSSWIVSDLQPVLARRIKLDEDSEPALPAYFPPEWRTYWPWSEPISFRAGRYIVQKRTGPVGALLPPGKRESRQ